MKTIKVIIVLLALSCLAASAIAKVTAFDPNPKDLKPNKYFTWGISFNLSQEKVITGGTLNCDSVYDAKTESDGRSYTYFLDNFAAGAGSPNDKSFRKNNFARQGVWIDSQRGKSRNFGSRRLLDGLDIFTRTPNGNGKPDIGFGIDPDNLHDNSKIEYVITPSYVPVVPVPGAIVLGSIGTCLVGWLRRRKTL